jgi:transcriptional regulator with GAF, ATPase, and Fis domain
VLVVPSRERLRSLAASADAVSQTTAVGFARAGQAGRVLVTYAYRHGAGEFALPADGLPDVLAPAGTTALEADRVTLESERARAVEAFLLDNHTARVISFPLTGVDLPTRCWFALAGGDGLAATGRSALGALAESSRDLWTRQLSSAERLERLDRLELAAELIPALLHVLDVREVIERLSVTARRALPHDLLLLNTFSEDFSTFTVYARSDRGAGLGMVRPNRYPASTLQAWTYSVVDDHPQHPFERDAPITKLGVRSSLRFPVRFDDRVIGGVTFASMKPHAFSDLDVPIGTRLAEHVASALSHFRLAEQLAAEAKRAEALRAQTTKIELVDELLIALIDAGDIAEVFDRISTSASKVLPHDAAALLVHEADGRRGRIVASRGYPAGLPDIADLPDDERNPSWEHDIVDDVAGRAGQVYTTLERLGFRSLMRAVLRIDGRAGGTLTFASREAGAFNAADLPVARRMADRLAVTLLRDREIEASRRADEASTRAARLEARVKALTEELDARTGYRRVVGDSPSWRQALTQATQVAATDTTVLLLGESGTGKEVVARFLHRASPRSGGPFIALNCAALPEHLLEAELFGYERGAFTGATQSKPGQLEQAGGGTLFLDEVGEMSLPAQAKFLRVLQEREFQRLGGSRVLRTDARIVAATNRDLQKAIANGQFREDLFYRLNVFAIRLPPLRERKDDILPLTEAFLGEFGRAFASPPAGISREARQRLLSYHWPGNIRELRNILERAAILSDGGLITEDLLGLPAMTAAARPPAAIVPVVKATPVALDEPSLVDPGAAPDLASVEKAMIVQALQTARFNKSKAAKALGLTRHQLYIRMRRHGIDE